MEIVKHMHFYFFLSNFVNSVLNLFKTDYKNLLFKSTNIILILMNMFGLILLHLKSIVHHVYLTTFYLIIFNYVTLDYCICGKH